MRRMKRQVREKVGKSRFTVFFPMICGSGGSKSRLAKAVGAEPAGQMKDEKLHTVVPPSKFASKKRQKHLTRLEVEMSKKCASFCGAKHISSQKCKKLTVSDHFWKLRCRKSAPYCTKHAIVAPLLEVEMSKKCASLWREAHTQHSAHFWEFRG